MTEWLSDTYEHMTTKQVWKIQDGGIIYNLFNGPSLFDDSPALQTITDIVAPFGETKRQFVVSSVDVETGEYCAFND